MKSDTERKKFHSEKLHKRKSRLHVHLSKELRGKVKTKTRAIMVRKGDTVKVVRGPAKGKETKVAKVSVLKRKVYLEGVTVKTTKGKEVQFPVEPSNLVLIALEPSKERKDRFSESAFKKKEEKKPAQEKVDANSAPANDAAKPDQAKSSEKESKPVSEKTEKPPEKTVKAESEVKN